MSRKKSSTVAKGPTNERLVELACTVIDPQLVLGPVDEQEIREAMIELLERRNRDNAPVLMPAEETP